MSAREAKLLDVKDRDYRHRRMRLILSRRYRNCVGFRLRMDGRLVWHGRETPLGDTGAAAGDLP